jgi:hypothetical protein
VWRLLCIAGLASLVSAQSVEGEVSSRAQAVVEKRKAKAAVLRPEEPSFLHRGILYVREKKMVERFMQGVSGFRAVLGGLGPGSGFGGGIEYLWTDLPQERVRVRGSVSASPQEFWMAEAQFTLPKLANGRVFVDTLGQARRSPQIDYYGPGSASQVTGRTVYAMEETSLGASAGVHLVDRFRVGVAGRYLAVNVGPANRPEFASTETVYSAASTPGLDQQSSFWAGGPFVEYDSRDIPGGPRNGGLYRGSYSQFADTKLDRHSFQRVDAEAQRYFSFFNGRKVIALRARTNLTDTDGDDVVPFYLQPQLGGANDLRGFRARRFYGDNAFVMNAEYRWEVFSGLDAALFVDAGKVFQRWGDLDFRNLETSSGFGLRFNIGNVVFLRGDVAFGREGPQAWIVLENVF